jgi:hypothetical protein
MNRPVEEDLAMNTACTGKLVRLAVRTLACTPFCLVAFAPAGAQDLLRVPWRAYEAGVSPAMAPNSIATGDVDDDGDADALLGLYFFGGPGIAVVKGEGGTAFGGLRTYGVGYDRMVGDVALADVDGDDDLDALATVTGNFDGRVIALWRNNGSGGYGTPSTFATGEGPTGIVAGDFTGDGFVDVVTADAGFPLFGETVSLLVHNGQTGGAAGFLPPRSFFCDNAPDVVRAGDFDGDGDLDLVVGRGTLTLGAVDGTVVLLNEDGAGSFGPPTHYEMSQPALSSGSALAVADLDRDGRLDLVGTGNSRIGVRLGAGDGSFGALRTFPLAAGTYRLRALTTGDLNGDRYPDIVGTSPTGRAVDGFHVLLSDGTGGYRADAFYEAAKQTYDAELVDTDGDGDLDVVTAANDSSVVTVHENDGSGRFFVPQRFFAGSLMSGMDSADIDDDGDLDIATADSDINVLRNRGDGTFDPRFVVRVPIDPLTVRLRDMNNDGAPDILTSNQLSSDFVVALNRGDGTFMQPVLTPMGGSQGGSVDAFDIDADGILDVVVTDPGPVPAIRLAHGVGNGTSFDIQPPLEFGSMPMDIGAADFDHDGHLDLATSANAFGFTVFPGRGDFTFEPMLQTGVQSLLFELADLDADGETDVVYDAGARTDFTEWVGVLRGYGDGTFRFPEEYPGPIGLESPFRISSDVGAGDMNGDGRPDLVLTNNAPNDVAIFTANPDGSLNPMQRYGVGYQAHHTSIGDFNGDDVIDIATAISLPPSGISDAVVVLAGRERRAFDLAIEGTCPGAMTIRATGATPNGLVRFLRATGTGNAVWPGGACAGTQLGLDESVRPLRSVTANAAGVASFTLAAPPGACGVILIQAMDASSCTTSDVGAL